MRSINIKSYNLPTGKEWKRVWQPKADADVDFFDDDGNHYELVGKRTPAGFDCKKQTADAVSELVWHANNSLQTAVSMLITTYESDDKIPAEIQKRCEAIREVCWRLKDDIDHDLRGLE